MRCHQRRLFYYGLLKWNKLRLEMRETLQHFAQINSFNSHQNRRRIASCNLTLIDDPFKRFFIADTRNCWCNLLTFLLGNERFDDALDINSLSAFQLIISPNYPLDIIEIRCSNCWNSDKDSTDRSERKGKTVLMRSTMELNSHEAALMFDVILIGRW